MAYATTSFDLVNFKVASSKRIIGYNKQIKQQRFVTFNSVNGVVPRINGVKKLKVAYQGVPGAFSEFAAKQAFSDCIPLPCRAFLDAITAVEEGKADLAVLPVESTMEGTELRNYDLLLQHDLPIVQEINLYVHYCLLAMPGVSKGELKKVISHPLALAHCGKTLAQLGLDHEAVEDTAGAVELLLSNRMFDTAAIASSQAALLYGLDVLAHGVQDESWNVTRFLILSKDLRLRSPKGRNKFGSKTSMVVAHHSGTLNVLLKLLSAFSTRDINLTKLEVNPSRTNGTPVLVLDPKEGGPLKEFPCILYVDFEGSMDDQNVKDALAEISEFPVFIRTLGSYSADPNIYGLQ
ncbi:Arogenate dehydratase/prephenate dehydratase 6 protein [Thalictrum thalictroides]|uniref:Arogenate dehydratase/prephenate dehydratase 6 protein n=1 Tax=Thalictrum thalictroides TaxID=46969 RepID=A0A7J6VTH4_THATH|nr:Arogenate dehydratase/prephenate dehydratase 6 protein [Thalictrum thalictroides]